MRQSDRSITKRAKSCAAARGAFHASCLQTKEYKEGNKVSFDLRVNALGGGHFDGHVWR